MGSVAQAHYLCLISHRCSYYFWFRKSQAKSEELLRKNDLTMIHSALYAIVTIQGESVEIEMFILNVEEAQWDANTQQIMGKSPEIKRHNKRLAEVKVKLERIFDMLQIDYEHVAAPSLVKDFFTEKRLFRFHDPATDFGIF